MLTMLHKKGRLNDNERMGARLQSNNTTPIGFEKTGAEPAGSGGTAPWEV